MKNEIVDISFVRLAIGFAFFAIPIALFLYYKIRIVKDVLIGALRMAIQLGLVALYLEWIFQQNNAWLNSLWVFIMLWVGVLTTIRRVKLNWRYFVIPLFLASLTSVLIVDAFFLGYVIQLDYFFDARYFIPITGMILDNALSHNIVGLTAYFDKLSQDKELYYFIYTNTGKRKLALNAFISEGIKKGLNPLIASMTVIGLITLPGMMTGQILGGSSPAVAIKYQIMIMIAIFVGCTLNLFLSILYSNRILFNKMGRVNLEKLKN